MFPSTLTTISAITPSKLVPLLHAVVTVVKPLVRSPSEVVHSIIATLWVAELTISSPWPISRRVSHRLASISIHLHSSNHFSKRSLVSEIRLHQNHLVSNGAGSPYLRCGHWKT
jgi:hypothetical protein